MTQKSIMDVFSASFSMYEYLLAILFNILILNFFSFSGIIDILLQQLHAWWCCLGSGFHERKGFGHIYSILEGRKDR
jgi:uncharacterized membrane protein